MRNHPLKFGVGRFVKSLTNPLAILAMPNTQFPSQARFQVPLPILSRLTNQPRYFHRLTVPNRHHRDAGRVRMASRLPEDILGMHLDHDVDAATADEDNHSVQNDDLTHLNRLVKIYSIKAGGNANLSRKPCGRRIGTQVNQAE